MLTICKSIENRQPLDCTAECWKKQRNQRLADAFGSSKDLEENKQQIQFEYYPEDSIEFAQKNEKFAQKVESQLTDVVLHKSSRSFLNLTSSKRAFLTRYVYEHFKLDMCTYGSKLAGKSSSNTTNGKAVTDVFWKEGCRVPEILVSEVIKLIEKGFMSSNHEATRNKIFEASLVITGVPKGSGLDEIKRLLNAF